MLLSSITSGLSSSHESPITKFSLRLSSFFLAICHFLRLLYIQEQISKSFWASLLFQVVALSFQFLYQSASSQFLSLTSCYNNTGKESKKVQAKCETSGCQSCSIQFFYHWLWPCAWGMTIQYLLWNTKQKCTTRRN